MTENIILSAICKMVYFLPYDRYFEISCVDFMFKINFLSI